MSAVICAPTALIQASQQAKCRHIFFTRAERLNFHDSSSGKGRARGRDAIPVRGNRRGHSVNISIDCSVQWRRNSFMARSLRIERANGVYHVINRGNYRQDLFINEGAHGSFGKCLFEACGKCGWILEGYCVMSLDPAEGK